MAKDVPTGVISDKGVDRISWDYSFLSPSSLPYFLADKVKLAWKNIWPNIELRDDNPDDDNTSPGITWKIHHRVPGKGNVTPIKAEWLYDTVREETKDVIRVYRQYQTVTYEFIIHARDGLHQLVDDFESFLLNIVPELQNRKVENFYFAEEVRSDLINGGRQQEIPKRTLRYTAHLQKKYELVHSMLQSLDLEASAGKLEQEDIVILRSRAEPFDYIPIKTGPFLLTCVCDLPIEDLLYSIRTASTTGGIDSLNAITSQHIFIQDTDYAVGVIEDDSTGTKLPGIIWLDSPGSKAPQKGTAYYLSLRTSHLVVNIKTTRPEE